jgi:hypothetical protein
VESLAVNGMPLKHFVGTVSEMAGVSITLDPVAMELAGASPLSQVSVQANGVTLEKLLRDTLAKQRLELVERDGQSRIELADHRARSTKKYEVADLLEPGAADASGIARLVEEFVSPQTWQKAGGEGTIESDGTSIRVDQAKSVHHELLIFCERLRLARGLSQRTKYPADRLPIDSPYGAIATKLGQHTTFTFLPWTRLSDVFRHWEQSSGLTILVDWTRLAEMELSPSTPAACSAIDRTWNEALSEILSQLGLAWWAADRQSIQITTREAIDNIQRVEFHSVPRQLRDQFASDDALLESLEDEVRNNIGAANFQDSLRMKLDSPSRRLIVRGTPDVHRYLSERFGSADAVAQSD